MISNSYRTKLIKSEKLTIKNVKNKMKVKHRMRKLKNKKYKNKKYRTKI